MRISQPILGGFSNVRHKQATDFLQELFFAVLFEMGLPADHSAGASSVLDCCVKSDLRRPLRR
jgi:hypothetical protein